MKFCQRCAFIFVLVTIMTAPFPAFAEENNDWNIVLSRVFKEIQDINTFAFAIPLYRSEEKFLSLVKSKANTNTLLLNSDYVLVYTPSAAKVNNIWYLLEVDRITGKASVIGRGGDIEYLESDLFDAAGFNELDTSRCEKTGTFFPQRRIQSCKQVDCLMTLELNGQGSSPSYTYIFGKKGWYLHKSTENNNDITTCVFDTVKSSYLLEIGKAPLSPTDRK